MAPVDTSSSKLSVFVCFSVSALAEAEQEAVLKPSLFMNPEGNREWIPLNVSFEAAHQRALWGAEERNETNLHPKDSFRFLRIEFTALGFGHYYLNEMLTTRDYKSWRFHGELPFSVASTNG